MSAFSQPSLPSAFHQSFWEYSEAYWVLSVGVCYYMPLRRSVKFHLYFYLRLLAGSAAVRDGLVCHDFEFYNLN